MSTRQTTSLIILSILLTAGIILCAVRWKAWFVNPEEPAWTGDTVQYTFHTFNEESLDGFAKYRDGHSAVWQDLNQPDTLAFLLLGDVHNGMDSIQWATLAARHPYLDFYAQLGDFIERGYFFYVQQLESELEGTPFEHLPLVNTPGNHEYRKGIIRRLPDLWYGIFPQPLNGPQRFLGSTYYIDFTDLRLIVIDTNGLQRLSDYTIVNTWVRQALQEAGDRFTVVMMHHPVCSVAKGRQNPLVWLTFKRVLLNADIVFAGHDHNYARQLPFIVTNSAGKYYKTKKNPNVSFLCSEKRVYNIVTVKRYTPSDRLPSTRYDTLSVETHLLETGELIDLVQVVHQPDSAATDNTNPATFLRTYIEPMAPALTDSLCSAQLGIRQ